METIDKLLNMLEIARSLSYTVLEKEIVKELAKVYGISIVGNRYNSLRDIRLYTPVARSNRITMIKELRERAMENGLDYGLKEAKEEVDRRTAENTESYSWTGQAL